MYTGAGSGLTRAQLYTPNIKFENDERLKEFVVTIWRDSSAEISEVYDRVHDRVGEDKSLIQNELLGDGSAVKKRAIEQVGKFTIEFHIGCWNLYRKI